MRRQSSSSRFSTTRCCTLFIFIFSAFVLVWNLTILKMGSFHSIEKMIAQENEEVQPEGKKRPPQEIASPSLSGRGEIKESSELSSPKLNANENEVHPITTETDQVHVVFSTDCSFYQDWQSLLVFFSAVTVGQKGRITRIASGCNEEKQRELVKLYEKLYPQYDVHFTPDFKKDGKTKKSYDFYNKPYGLEHLLDHNPDIKSGTVLALIDPDFIFLRPLTSRIKDEPNNIFYGGGRNDNPGEGLTVFDRVGPSRAASQKYGLGAPWASDRARHFNRTDVCGKESPCLRVSRRYGDRYFSVGPPYLLERDDLLRLTKSWTAFVPKVFERYPELLAEMYAYSMAAAHEQLPHLTLWSYMVSNTFAEDEGWAWIDALGDDVCQRPENAGETSLLYPGKPLPTFLHFCQFFRAGELGFQKRRVHKSIFECDKPMLVDPPMTLGKVDYKNRDGEIIKLDRTQARRNAFSLCVIHRSINALLTHYKKEMCDPRTVNLNKTLNLAVDWS